MLKNYFKAVGILLFGGFFIYCSPFAHATPNIKKVSSEVVATINGEAITQAEIDKVLSRYKNQIPQEQLSSVKRQVLNGLISQKLFLQFIDEKGIKVSKEEVEAELDKVRADIKQNPSLKGKSLEEVLASHGSTVEDLKNDIIVSLSLEKHLSKNLDEQKLKEFFEENKSVYSGTEVKASHILVDTQECETEEELLEAEEEINKIKTEVDKGKKDFAALAEEYSDCPSAKKGGDLGFFKRKGQMIEPFAAAAFALNIGETSEPLKTQYGYHIIKVTDKKEGENVKFDDIKEQVKLDLLKNYANDLLERLKQQAQIEIKSDI